MEQKQTTGTEPVFPPSQDLHASKSAMVQEALADIQQSMGSVLEPFLYLTEESLPGFWQETKAIEWGTEAALEPKYRDLINLGVAAQIPCRYNIYFDLKSGQANGATAQEQTEAVLMSATTRHWSTVLNGVQIPMEEFRRELDQILAYVKGQMGKAPPPREAFLVKCASAAEAYRDIEQTLGLVPKFMLAFPEHGLPGAWAEFKGVQLNPYTAIPPKYKELIGLAVSAQIPCSYCVTFHREVATLHGASSEEIHEAIAHSALTRQWSTLANGLRLSDERFYGEINRTMEYQQQHHHA